MKTRQFLKTLVACAEVVSTQCDIRTLSVHQVSNLNILPMKSFLLVSNSFNSFANCRFYFFGMQYTFVFSSNYNPISCD